MNIDPLPQIPENRYNPALDSDFVHNDDITSSEMGTLNGFPVRFITIDRDAIARRNLGYIKESIRLRTEREAKQALAANEFTSKLAMAAA